MRVGVLRRWLTRRGRWTVLVAAAVAYAPVLASSPRMVGADTKAYLYLDPERLLAGATSLWDADRALGTVTHQNIGFVWPMGPYYWLFDTLGVPDWVAQRLWLATLIFAAGAGVRYLVVTLGFVGNTSRPPRGQHLGLLVAMMAYQLSPYLLHYSARISVVLLPWAALGWMVGLTVRAARCGGWRHPALFALLVLTAGSVNATSLLLAGLAPVLWLVHATVTERSISGRQALLTAARIGLLTAGVSAWWAAGLFVQGAYSLPVTRFTETYQVVAAASSAPEILRGLGYWFFYGNDKFGAWIEPSVAYTQGGWLIFTGFGLVVAALVAAALVRWRHRGYFVLLLVVGALVAVGAHPPGGSSALGGLFERFTQTDLGLALRSTPRAAPMVVLATSVLVGVGAAALARRAPRLGVAAGVVLLVAVVLANPAMWRVRMIEANLARPEALPAYWHEAAAALDAAGTVVGQAEPTRVWEIPGSDFASYRWGMTVDPITPGLIDRGYVARELVPFGSAQSAALLGAIDRRLQEDTLDAAAIAPMARLMGVGEVVHRGDLAFERYRTPRPPETHALLEAAPGLSLAGAHGDPAPNVAGPQQTLIDEIHLARDAAVIHPPPVSRFDVHDPLPLLRTRPTGGATVLVGDADGVVNAAGAGVLDLRRPLWFAADLLAHPQLWRLTLDDPAHLIVTDTNRRRAQRWGTLRENRGHTEQAGEQPLVFDPTDSRLEVFESPAAGVDPDDTRTVSQQRGPVSATATAYGNPVTYTNGDRPYLSVDGDLSTAWVVAAFDEPRGEMLRLTLSEPGPVSSVRLVQPLGRAERHVTEANRRITEVEIRADGHTVTTAGLDGRSLTADGQTIPLGVTAQVVDIVITDTDVPVMARYPGVAPVGFAEVDLNLGPTREVIRTPTALLEGLGSELDRHRVSVLLTRERSNPREPVRTDAESQMTRAVALPTARQATVAGTARLSAYAPEALIDELLGVSPASLESSVGALLAASSGYLPGDLPSRASAAIDGNASTAWTGRFGPQAGQWIELQSPEPVTFDTIELDMVVGSEHSLPAVLRVYADGADLGTHHLGEVAEPVGNSPPAQDPSTDGRVGGANTDAAAAPEATVTVTLPVAATARTVRVDVVEAHERLTRDWYSGALVALPVSLAEIRLGGADTQHAQAATRVDTGCRSDLLTVAGSPVAVRITGSAGDAVDREPLLVQGCEPITLPAGDVVIETAAGAATGLDIDQLVLDSPRPIRDPAEGIGAVTSAVRHSDTGYTVTVPASPMDRWLVLGQSHNAGWHATVAGADLGAPVVIDAFANAWLLPASNEPVTVELRWTPQRYVNVALAVSAAFVLVCLALAFTGRRDAAAWRRSRSRLDEPHAAWLIWPWERHLGSGNNASRTGRWRIVAALVVTALAAINLPTGPIWWPMAAPLVGVAFLVAARRRRLEVIPALGAALLVGVAALYVLVQQYRHRYPPDFVWPQHFGAVHALGVLAMCLLIADYALTCRKTKLR